MLLRLEGAGLPTPREMHGFVTDTLERGFDVEHHSQAKDFTVRDFRRFDAHRGLWALDLALLSDGGRGRIAHAVERSKGRVFIGPLRGCVITDAGPSRCVRRVAWDDLRKAPAEARASLWFASPVLFRRRDGQVPAPTAKLILGHYRRRWRAFAPETCPDLDFGDLDLDLTTDGEVVLFEAPVGPRGRWHRGFVGEAHLEVRGRSRDIASVAALVALAPFSGTGAFTTAGFGVTRLGARPGR